MPKRFDENGYWEIITRQMSIVTKNQQKRFKNSKIAVIGCGGIGGVAIEMLGRMGVGELNIIDKDSFDMTNLNRQTMSSFDSINLPKSNVAKEKMRLVNPYLKINSFNEKLTENNISKVVDNCDVIIDALDNIITRIIVSRYSKEHNIPFIHGAVHGTMGQLTTFTWENEIDYETMFSLPSKNKKLNNEVKKEISQITSEIPPVIGPVPNIIGTLQAMEAFKLIVNIGEVIKAPKILNFDLLNFNSFNITEI